MQLKLTGDLNRDEALSEAISGCIDVTLACKQLLQHCPNKDEQWIRARQAAHRYGGVCSDTLRVLLDWESHDLDTLRDILENCIFEGELASREFDMYVPHDRDEKPYVAGLRGPIRGCMCRCAELSVECFSSCEEFIRVWIDPDAMW